MNQTQFIKLFAFATVLTLTSMGCQSSRYITPLGDRAPSGSKGATGALADAAPASVADPVTGEADASGLVPLGGRHDGWKEDGELFKSYRVHFDYDSSVVSLVEKKKLEAVAAQLKADPTAAVKIEGHCDERGTEEYNRALGERRALALREELIRLGIDPSRVDTISYADNRPLVTDHAENGWRQNRRGEFVSLMPQ